DARAAAADRRDEGGWPQGAARAGDADDRERADRAASRADWRRRRVARDGRDGARSEERRVGKECRAGRSPEREDEETTRGRVVGAVLFCFKQKTAYEIFT